MSYIALYRQWRPQKFSEIVGQDTTVTGLLNALKEHKLAHAYLFSGPRGTGKTSAAKLLARAVNCAQPSGGEPCNQCPTCVDILNGSAMDVIEIDAASNRGIDEIRDLREKIRVLPAQGKKKVYIIDEVHMLTTEAFNALLKTLEDPPESVIFVLATTEPHKIPATVLSRCQRYSFKRLTVEEITVRLRQVCAENNIVIAPEALEVIARRANGSMRDALSTLDQCISFQENNIELSHVMDVLGLVDHETLAEILKAALEGRVPDMLQGLDSLIRQGKEPIQIAKDAALCARDLLIYKILPANGETLILNRNFLSSLDQLCQRVSAERLADMVKHLLKLADDMRFQEEQRFMLEVGFMELSGSADAAEIVPSARGRESKPKDLDAALPEKPPVQSPQHIREWDKILDKVKAAKVTTHALLAPARLVSFEQGILTLGYKPELNFHREKMEEKGNREILLKAVQEALGQEVSINIINLRDETQQPEVVRKAVELFGPDKVEIID